MRKFWGRTKSKPENVLYIKSAGAHGRWHRIDPGNGARTACGAVINTATWSLPTSEEPTLSVHGGEVICSFRECQGKTVHKFVDDL
jgi:hypothetical protein